jgi:hypothetical protein
VSPWISLLTQQDAIKRPRPISRVFAENQAFPARFQGEKTQLRVKTHAAPLRLQHLEASCNSKIDPRRGFLAREETELIGSWKMKPTKSLIDQ